MNIEEYIASGILELYVSGSLSPKENEEVLSNARKYPEIQKEIEAIEATILSLTQKASPGVPTDAFDNIRSRIQTENTSIPLERETKKTNWTSYLGWAAAVVMAIGFVWSYLQNDQLKSDIEVTRQSQEELERNLNKARSEIADKDNILDELRNKDVSAIFLQGQQVSPDSYAKVFWNSNKNKVTIDAQGLPEPPEGYEYQVWSLKLEPLTPTSLGMLANFESNESKLFELENSNTSEAFGITLEPAGGSETPTMEQLYTLGAVGP